MPSYREFVPPPPLRPFVDRFWLHAPASTGSARSEQRILPDGCIDILLRLGAGAGAELVGTMTRACVTTGSEHCLAAVRFKPGGAVPFLGVAAHELTDQLLPLADFSRLGLDVNAAGAQSAADGVRALEQWLLRRVASVPKPEPRLEYASRRLFAPGPPTLKALAQELGSSRQHLRRLFLQHVGVTPKDFARMARLQRAILTLQSSPRGSLAGLALDLGYCDQAHLARDFRQIAGITATSARELGSIFPIRSLLDEAHFPA